MLCNTCPVIYVATDAELTGPDYYRRLWLAVRNADIPRRGWLDAIADALRDFDGEILKESGEPYAIPLVDDVFGDDPDLRWLGYYLRADQTGKLPLSMSRKLERLRILDLYFRIISPNGVA